MRVELLEFQETAVGEVIQAVNTYIPDVVQETGMPKEISPILFLRPRMDAWAIIFSQTINTKTPND